MHCFPKSKISIERQKATIADDEDPFKELEEATENICLIQQDLVSENMEEASFTDADAEVLAVQPPSSEAEILVKLLEAEDVAEADLGLLQHLRWSAL